MSDMRLAGCPECGADWPTFHSPVGTIETVCDNCGWASDEGREYEDVRLPTPPVVSPGEQP
jgi:hypothetical protein